MLLQHVCAQARACSGLGACAVKPSGRLLPPENPPGERNTTGWPEGREMRLWMKYPQRRLAMHNVDAESGVDVRGTEHSFCMPHNKILQSFHAGPLWKWKCSRFQSDVLRSSPRWEAQVAPLRIYYGETQMRKRFTSVLHPHADKTTFSKLFKSLRNLTKCDKLRICKCFVTAVWTRVSIHLPHSARLIPVVRERAVNPWGPGGLLFNQP